MLLKGCTIEACINGTTYAGLEMFQLLLKGCTIEARTGDETAIDERFQLLLKGCTIEALSELENRTGARVSVVVERMYD